MLETNRGMVKYFLLSAITFGIYGIVVMSEVSNDINTIASGRDGKHTMHYCWIYFLFSWLTLGIAALVWQHRITARVGDELRARNLPYEIGAGTYWGWCIFGSLLFGIGPFIYYYKFFKAMNMICDSYNKEQLFITMMKAEKATF